MPTHSTLTALYRKNARTTNHARVKRLSLLIKLSCLFICASCNETVRSSDNITANDRMIKES
jgi:hypothetical protein